MASNIFSESRGIVDDAFQNATDVEEVKVGVREGIRERVAMDGILMMADCPYCGLQWSGIIKWTEISGFFLGQQVPGTQAVPDGIAMQYGCRKCGKASPMSIGWDDVDRYVGAAVKRGWLPQAIYRAREQVLAERARQQGQRR